MLKLVNNFKSLLISELRVVQQFTGASIHTTSALDARWNKASAASTKFVDNNKKVFSPRGPDEEQRPAFVCHQKKDLKYSPKKMWYIASFIRGMSIDEAIKQLNFMTQKGAMMIKEALLEAQELAVKAHNVEFKSNLWVAESFTGKGFVLKGLRRHARGRPGIVEYKHTHYFVRLEEGKPPKNYYLPQPMTPEEQLNKWMEEMRNRKVINSL